MTTADGIATGDQGLASQRAIVVAALANGMFRLRMVDGREVLAHAAMNLRMSLVRLLPGDQVLVDLSPFDPDKARILKLLKSTQPSQHPQAPNTPQQRDVS